MKREIKIYDEERSYGGQNRGKELRSSILNILTFEGMKLSYVLEEINEKSKRKVSKGAVLRHLKKLEKEGRVKKLERGRYILMRNLS